MAFGRMGAGFGRMGAIDPRGGSGGGAPAVVGGAALLAGETDGLGVDFTYATDAARVAKKVASVTTEYGLDTFFANAGTTPRLVYDATGTLVWAPHNMYIQSATPATRTVTTIVGQQYTVSVVGSGSLTGSVGASGVATQASPLTFVATSTNSTFTLGGSLTQVQMNRGATATAYLATTAAARFGLAVDYDPVALTPKGLLSEPSGTNLALWGSDLSQSSWTKSNCTASYTAISPLGAANQATILTATAGNATALQAITSASSARITSVFLKRRTGSGNIDITQDNGSTWATQAITSSWVRYSIASVTSTNPTVGIRIVTSGDAVDVCFFQHETGAFITSPAPSFSVTGSRATDSITALTSTFPWSAAAANSILVTAAARAPAASTTAYLALHDGTDAERYIIDTNTGAQLGRMLVVDASATQANTGAPAGAPTANVYYKIGAAAATNDFACVTNASTPATDATGTLPTVTTLQVGGSRTVTGGNVYIKTLTIVPRRMTNVELQTKTT